MKVGTRLLLLASFAATVALSGWFVNQWSAARTEQALQQLHYANAVQRAVTRLNTRFGLYLSQRDGRSLDEWQRAREQLPSILAQKPEEHSRHVNSISYQSNSLAQLGPLIGTAPPDSPGQTLLTDRVYATLQDMTDDAARLANLAEVRIRSATEQSRLISQSLMFALALSLSLIAFPLAHGLKRRLDLMRQQMQHVTAGNLWLSLHDQSNDELGELARGFDTMLGRLRRTTFSIDQLNEEIERQTATLKEQQEYLQTLIEAEPACVLTLDRQGRILSLNNAGARMLLADSDSALGQSFSERFVDRDDRATFEALVETTFEGRSSNLQYRLHRPCSRETHWLQTYAVPFHDQRGKVSCIVTVSHDVSSRVREEQQIRDARAFLQNVVDSVQDAIVVRDIEGNKRLLNRTARDSEPGHPCNEPPRQQSRQGIPSLLSRRMLLGNGRAAEICTYQSHEGEWRHIERVATPLTQADGSLDGVIELYRDITENTRLLRELHEEQARLKQLAHHDLLTGLPNRSLFLDRLEQTLLRAQRDKRSFALLFIDLDRFKEINDSLGHQAGDAVLRMAAQRLSRTIRASDTLARLGGDEFTVIAPLHHDDDAAVLAQKLIKCIEPPYELDDHRLFVTTSIGISVYPNDGATTEVLISNADAAMYKAKEDGKNVYRYYSQQLTRRAMEQVSLASELHRALAQDEFRIHYQPQFDLQTLTPIGMEALVRWQHPTQGLLKPARFLPFAEGSGLILRIGNEVIEQVMRQTRRWRDERLNPGVVAINLSGRQIDSDRQLEWIEECLERHHCRPEWFELEVTEDFLMQNPEHAIEMFNRLRRRGFELAIDDFGTGFSSLSYLKRLPLTRLKIDRAFIQDLPGGSDDQAISRAIIALGQNLGLKVIAEGVETQAQAEFLRNAGCNEVQGYLFSHPRPADDITADLPQQQPTLQRSE